MPFPLPTIILLIVFLILVSSWVWLRKDRKYYSSESVADAYDSWTNDQLLEKLWGDHVHLGFYKEGFRKTDFKAAKVDFVHKLVYWSGLSQLPKGSRILDVGCGIGGSARILANDYGFDVLGISISSSQIKRATQLTSQSAMCNFEVMDALDLQLEKGSFDAVWSVEAGPHIPDKQRYADEMLRVLRPGGVLVVADWNRRDVRTEDMNYLEKIVMKQLLNQWAHPKFSSINSFRNNLLSSPYYGGNLETADWTNYTIPSWIDSILEGIRRPKVFFQLGLVSLLKGLREVPTILLMHWAFSIKLMQFGVFKARG